MPNWVTNTLTVKAEPALLKQIASDLAAPVTKKGHQWVEGTGMVWKDITTSEPLSFWNVITPPPDHLDEYFSDVEEKNPWYWYTWNVNHWGTKWDASDVITEHTADALTYKFDTAWSPPDGVYVALARKYPDAVILVHWIEEQGFGCEYEVTTEGINVTKEWGVPDSHAKEIEVQGYCWRCDSLNQEWIDVEDLWPDCPGYTAQPDEKAS